MLRTSGTPFVVGEGPEALDVDARWHDRDRQRLPGGVLGLGRRIPTGGDDVAGAAQHMAERLLRTGDPARDRHLGAVQHDVVRQRERRPDQPERDRRVEHDELGPDPARHGVDPCAP